jgi:nitrogen PTS system EIIA component
VKLSDILVEANVIADLKAVDKQAVLQEITEHLVKSSPQLELDSTVVLTALLERERQGSTGVGQGVAIPHARIPHLPQLVSVFARSRAGVGFDAIDQQMVNIFFLLLVPETAAGVHLKALSRIARLLKNDAFRRQLVELADRTALYAALLEEDAKVGS